MRVTMVLEALDDEGEQALWSLMAACGGQPVQVHGAHVCGMHGTAVISLVLPGHPARTPGENVDQCVAMMMTDAAARAMLHLTGHQLTDG